MSKKITLEVFSVDEKLPELNKSVLVWNDCGINYEAVYAGAKFLEPTGYEYAFILDFSVPNFFLPNEIIGWAYIPRYKVSNGKRKLFNREKSSRIYD